MSLTPVQKAALVGQLEDAAKQATKLADDAHNEATSKRTAGHDADLALASIAVSLAALTRAVAGVLRDDLEED